MPFLDSLDIANRALQHLGGTRIESIDEDTRNNQEMANAYDKLREAELRRNRWVFATKLACLRPMTRTTYLVAANQWSASKVYLTGAIVTDSNGDFWQSGLSENAGNTPGQSPAWDQYFGPTTADAWDSSQAYFAGELVYILIGPNSYIVLMSLESGNVDNPLTANFWDTTVIYAADQMVSFSIPPAAPVMYRSIIELNQGNQPSPAPQLWSAVTAYGAIALVTGSDFMQYVSLANGNLGNDPTTDGGVHWQPNGLLSSWALADNSTQTVAMSWRVIDAKLSNVLFTYPIGSGPKEQSVTRNVYRLPANYLRTAPQDPKAGVNPFLGAPWGHQSNDWEYQDGYIVSQDLSPIILRFIADVTYVPKMDPMFCEGLAARMAEATCEVLTQSTAKKQAVMADYNKFMGEARIIDSIESGSVEPPEDDYITCRV